MFLDFYLKNSYSMDHYENHSFLKCCTKNPNTKKFIKLLLIKSGGREESMLEFKLIDRVNLSYILNRN